MFGGTSGINTNPSTGGSGGFSFGSAKGAATATTTTSSSGGFSFGAPSSSTAANTGNPLFGGSSFGSKSSASTSGGFGFTGGAATVASTSNATTGIASFGQDPLKTQAITAPTFKGLGGIDVTSSTSSNSATNGKNEVISQAVKDENVPAEICKDVKAFEDYIAKEKEESNEIGKFSVRSLHKITEEINTMCMSLSTISTAVNKQSAYVEKLRDAFTKQLKHAEMGQCTQNTPPTLQHDNVAPLHYFIELTTSFDESIKLYRQQIDELESHLQSVPHSTILAPQDISLTLVKMQETFVTLASNLHSIHDNVKHLKDQYLAYRRIVHGDHTDVFAAQKENKHKPAEKTCRVRGLPPFQNLSNVAALAVASMMQPQQQNPVAPPQQTILPGFGNTGTTSNLFAPKATTASLFGAKPTATSTSSLFGSSGFGASSSKPPALSAGVASTSSGNIFFGNSTFNSSAGVTFGGTAANKNAFDLKPPPIGSKRNKK